VVPLIGALRDVDCYVRMAAAEALGRIGDTQAVAPLVRALGDPDVGVRGAAAYALGTIGPLAVPALLVALSAPNGQNR
jgi:HEAT repeat protein